MHNKKSYTVKQATGLLERFCMYQERCHKEIETKLYKMSIVLEAKEHIILHLLEHDFLNEERFSKSFARGKFRIKKWGKQRIVRELKSRDISTYNIKTALKEIDPQEYIETFNELAAKKLNAITESNTYKKRKKLMDYLRYRGWENELVYAKAIELIP